MERVRTLLRINRKNCESESSDRYSRATKLTNPSTQKLPKFQPRGKAMISPIESLETATNIRQSVVAAESPYKTWKCIRFQGFFMRVALSPTPRWASPRRNNRWAATTVCPAGQDASIWSTGMPHGKNNWKWPRSSSRPEWSDLIGFGRIEVISRGWTS
jgi:hypothetical protein